MDLQGFNDTATLVARYLIDFGKAVEDGLTQTGTSYLVRMWGPHFPFCLYGAVALVGFYRAWRAWEGRCDAEAREHSLSAILNALWALLQLKG